MSLTPKAIQKKRYILEKASNVFIREGYTCVTMKDIVEECEISRGGLYKYYGSTKEIFEDILSLEKGNDYSYFVQSMEKNSNAITMLNNFFQQQKNELSNEAVDIISKTLIYGISRNEITHLDKADVEKTAMQIVILLEGLSVLAMSMSVCPDLIQEQIDMIMKTII